MLKLPPPLLEFNVNTEGLLEINSSTEALKQSIFFSMDNELAECVIYPFVCITLSGDETEANEDEDATTGAVTGKESLATS